MAWLTPLANKGVISTFESSSEFESLENPRVSSIFPIRWVQLIKKAPSDVSERNYKLILQC